MQELIKNWPSILLLLAGMSAAWATYVANNKSEKQQQNIEELGLINKELGTKNNDLGEKIRNLSELTLRLTEENRELTDQSKLIIEEVKKLVGSSINIANENKDLTTQNKTLIQEVQKLNTSSYELINKLDAKTDNEYEVTGSFSFSIDSLENADQFEVILGKNPTMNAYNALELKMSNGNFRLLNRNGISLNLINNYLLLDAKIYDANGDIIAEVEKNHWRINKNSVSKFNYDNKGFEIFDNKGRIVFSIDIRKNGIFIRGIIPESELGKFVLYTDDTYLKFSNLDINTFSDYNKLYEKGDPITQMFEYNIKNWRHKRR
jgi:hypothetical protein